MQNKDDYLLLSQLTQAGYCLRRVALIMNEQLWQESVDTAKGRFEHDRVHEQLTERRTDKISLYSVRIYRLGNNYQNRIEKIGYTPIVETGKELIL